MAFLLRHLLLFAVAVPVAAAAALLGGGSGAALAERLPLSLDATATALRASGMLFVPVAVVATLVRVGLWRIAPDLWARTASRHGRLARAGLAVLVRPWPQWGLAVLTGHWVWVHRADPGVWLLGPLPLAPVQAAVGLLVGHWWTAHARATVPQYRPARGLT